MPDKPNLDSARTIQLAGTTYQVRWVDNAYILAKWDVLQDALLRAFSDSRFSDGFYPERPAEHTWNEINAPNGGGLKHLIIFREDGEPVAASFCVPLQRRTAETSCDLGWFFVDTDLPNLRRVRLTDELVRNVHHALAAAGYETIVTEMGTDSGAQLLSKKHGYIPTPTDSAKNRWMANLKEASIDEVNAKSEKRRWGSSSDQDARYATVDLEKDELIINLKPIMQRAKVASTYTLQLTEGHHYRSSVGPLAMNHSCSPNGYFRFDDLTFRALHDIAAGQEITFHYCTTEYELANPFQCLCGSPQCLDTVRGFRFLDKDDVERITPLLSPFLRSKL